MNRPNQDTDKRVMQRIKQVTSDTSELRSTIAALSAERTYLIKNQKHREKLWKSRVKELQAQVDEKEKLLITAFVDAKTGVVQMTRKYDEWIIYLQAAIKGEG